MHLSMVAQAAFTSSAITGGTWRGGRKDSLGETRREIV
jgi:hypothetical protein